MRGKCAAVPLAPRSCARPPPHTSALSAAHRAVQASSSSPPLQPAAKCTPTRVAQRPQTPRDSSCRDRRAASGRAVAKAQSRRARHPVARQRGGQGGPASPGRPSPRPWQPSRSWERAWRVRDPVAWRAARGRGGGAAAARRLGRARAREARPRCALTAPLRCSPPARKSAAAATAACCPWSRPPAARSTCSARRASSMRSSCAPTPTSHASPASATGCGGAALAAAGRGAHITTPAAPCPRGRPRTCQAPGTACPSAHPRACTPHAPAARSRPRTCQAPCSTCLPPSPAQVELSIDGEGVGYWKVNLAPCGTYTFEGFCTSASDTGLSTYRHFKFASAAAGGGSGGPQARARAPMAAPWRCGVPDCLTASRRPGDGKRATSHSTRRAPSTHPQVTDPEHIKAGRIVVTFTSNTANGVRVGPPNVASSGGSGPIGHLPDGKKVRGGGRGDRLACTPRAAPCARPAALLHGLCPELPPLSFFLL